MRIAIVLLIFALAGCGDDTTNNGTPNGAVVNNAADMGTNNSANDAGGSDEDAAAPDMAEEDSGSSEDAGETDMASGSDSCDPYAVDSGCEQGEMCVPDVRDETSGAIVGTCEPAGMAELGDDCDGASAATTCGDGLFCRDTCTPHCDPEAPAAAAGACGADQGCVPVTDENGDTRDWGACNDSCIYTHGDPANPAVACDGDSVCFPGEVLGGDFDFCGEAPTYLDTGADCATEGLEEFDLCGLNSVCIDLDSSGNLLCRDFCFPSAGDFGTSPHPDCRVASDTCEDVFAGADFGLCN